MTTPNNLAESGEPLDLRAIAEKHARAEGASLEDGLWLAMKGLMAVAMRGDVAACRLLFDRLGGTLNQAPNVSVDVVTGVPQSLSNAERVHRLDSLFASVRERIEGEQSEEDEAVEVDAEEIPA